jgi:hypothetical protein
LIIAGGLAALLLLWPNARRLLLPYSSC